MKRKWVCNKQENLFCFESRKMHWIHNTPFNEILKIILLCRKLFSKMMAELSSKRKMSRLSYQSANSSGIMNQQHPHPKLDRQRNLTLRSRSSRVEPLGRSSLRSKGSSNSSEDKVKMFKNCVRKMIEFLFTQVGVGAVVVCFTIVGASIFQVCTHYQRSFNFFSY